MLATILNQGEQRLWEDECVRVIRSGGPLPTTQVKSFGSQTSSGSRPPPPPLPNAPASKTAMLLGKEPVLRGKTTNDDDKREARRIMSFV